MSDSKKHHFLPQFYLKKFKDESYIGKNPRIYFSEKVNNPKFIPVAIKDTACISDYHTIDYSENKDRNTIEQSFSTVENEQSVLLDNILINGDLSNIQEISFFISCMLNRVPQKKGHISEILRQQILTNIDLLSRSGKLPEPPEKLKKMLDKKSFEEVITVDIKNYAILHYMLDVAQSEKILKIISSMNFSLIHNKSNNEFIISDNPVIQYSKKYNVNNYYGLLDPEIELIIPISKFVALKADRKKSKNNNINNNALNRYNAMQIINSERYIYSSRNNLDVLKQIKKYYSLSSGMEFDKLDFGSGKLHISRSIPVHDDMLN